MDANLTTSGPTHRPASAYPSLLQGFGLVLLLLLFGIPAAIPSLLILEFAPAFKALGDALAYALTFGLVIWYGQRQRGQAPLAFVPVKATLLFPIALGTLALGLLIEPITSALPSPDWLNEMMREAFTKDAILSAVLLAPVLEEVLLRGIMLDGFLKRYSPTNAIVWSAVIFGLMHMNPVQTVGATLLGLALGWLYYRTQSLWPCVFMHFVNNSLGSLTLYLDETPDMHVNYTRQLIENDTAYMGLLIGCVLISYGMYRVLDRMMPRPTALTPTAPVR